MSDLWTAVGPLDLLDILVVAFLIYRLLVVVRGTRAIQVLGGLLLLAGLYGISRILELSTVNWILEKFSFYFVLAVIILFQEDIRRALARFGNPLIGAGTRREQLSTYQSVARACFRLADQGCGALIAVERRASLDEFERDAALIDGLLSEELLVSIFQKASPIHDGAVLLREERVWLAGVFLPLSVRGGVDPRYGTRHRAAIGLTEQTDAFVFVVSEDRRSVSIAFRAELHHVESPDELRLKVQELLSMEEIETSPPIGFTNPTVTPVATPKVAASPPVPSAVAQPAAASEESGAGLPPMAADLSAAPPIESSPPPVSAPASSSPAPVPAPSSPEPPPAPNSTEATATAAVPLVELPRDGE
jgi:diadenylate cyclase